MPARFVGHHVRSRQKADAQQEIRNTRFQKTRRKKRKPNTTNDTNSSYTYRIFSLKFFAFLCGLNIDHLTID